MFNQTQSTFNLQNKGEQAQSQYEKINQDLQQKWINGFSELKSKRFIKDKTKSTTRLEPISTLKLKNDNISDLMIKSATSFLDFVIKDGDY